MKNKKILAFYLATFFILIVDLSAKTIIVDKSGLGQYKTIQAGINAALAGDTVKVFPGIYDEQINVGKDIVIQGSGYEYTQIVSNSNPAVSISSGKIMWFAISSNTGVGIGMTGGTVTNCVIWNCPDRGIEVIGGTTAIVVNCNIIDNYIGKYGGQVYVKDGLFTVINSIIRNTSDSQSGAWVQYGNGKYNLLYSCLGISNSSGINLIISDPKFVSSTNYKISSSSPCWDTGKPDIYDPDGSRSDIGYYGGVDAPVFPVIYDLKIYYNPDGSVNIEATASSRY